MFTEKEIQMKREAELTASMLKSGLHSLRHASAYGRIGEYYQSFFSLSIGIERMLKIIIITKFRCDNEGEFPKISECPIKGHNLIELWQKAELKNLEGIEYNILLFLDHFAGYSRYFNLDNILENHGKNIMENGPLYEWRMIQLEILKMLGKRKCLCKSAVSGLWEKNIYVSFLDLQGNEVDDLVALFEDVANEEVIQSYATQYVFNIIKSMNYKIRNLEKEKLVWYIKSDLFLCSLN